MRAEIRVRGGETGELHRPALHLKAELVAVALGVQMHLQGVILRGRHLARDKTIVDQFIDQVLVARDLAFQRLGITFERDRTDRFVRVLRLLFHRELIRKFGIILRAEGVGDISLCRPDRIVRNAHRVGTDIGDQGDVSFPFDLEAFVQLLCDLHDLRRAHRKLRGRVLLQGAGRERRHRHDLLHTALNLVHDIGLILDLRKQFVEGGFVRNFELLAVHVVKDRLKGLLSVKQGVKGPVLLGLETADLAFPVHDHAKRGGLHATG